MSQDHATTPTTADQAASFDQLITEIAETRAETEALLTGLYQWQARIAAAAADIATR